MTNRGNIKLPAAEFEKHNERRKEMGLSWTAYIDGQSPEQGSVGVDLTPLMNRIDDLETELTKQHEDMTGGR